MDDTSIPIEGSRLEALRHGSAMPAWTRLRALLTFRKPALSPRPEGQRRTAPAPAEPPPVQGASATPFPLLNAYAASTVEIARHAGALDPGGCLDMGPVAVQALVGEVVRDLEPRARQAGLTLYHDSHSHRDGVCCADPSELRRVLSHLLLRALSMESAPGHVRVAVSFTNCEARILVLSRTPEAVLSGHADAARKDLVAPQRLLQAMGGSLVLEPRRAGYLPLCIALPALFALSDLHAA